MKEEQNVASEEGPDGSAEKNSVHVEISRGSSKTTPARPPEGIAGKSKKPSPTYHDGL